MAKKIPIFYYHSIGGPPPETLALEHFESHLKSLKLLSYNTITFADLLKGNYNPELNNAVLSFDDGLLDNYENALPLLLSYGFKATFFVIPGFDNITRWVNPKTGNWSDTVKEGYTIPFKNMQTQHRRELLQQGMEIGCHSFTHPELSRIPSAELGYQIIDAKRHLEDELGCAIETFCYPRGKYNAQVVEVVKQAGYLGATTTFPGYFNSNRDLFRANRFLIENPYFFEDVLQGYGMSPYHYLKARWRLKNDKRPVIESKVC